eukprot:SAG31_NODE_8139_length_1513_cov_2.099717_2_plen_168_part_00
MSDAVTLWAIRVAALPADEDHPYGHGRFETVGTCGVAAMLVATGAGLGWHALDVLMSTHDMIPAIVDPDTGERLAAEGPTAVAVYAAALSIAVKEGLYRVTKAVGEQENSSVVVANAQHHRSDALSSIVALFGIAGAQVGWSFLDPMAALCVAMMVAKAGMDIGVSA